MNKTITSLLRRARGDVVDTRASILVESTLLLVLVGAAFLLMAPRVGFDFNRDGLSDIPVDRRMAGVGGVEGSQLHSAIARRLISPSEFFAGCLTMLAASIGFVVWRRRRSQPTYGRRRGDYPKSGSAGHDAASRTRMTQKRLKILGTLVNDHHKLLPSDLIVGDLMTTVVRTALPSTPIEELRAMTIEYDIRHVLVCNADKVLVGVVSDRDLRRVSGKLVASDLMAECPTTVTSTLLLNNAISLLLYGHISSLPVVDDGRLVGILTTTDVVMTLQCTMLAVEQMVRDLRAGPQAATTTPAAS